MDYAGTSSEPHFPFGSHPLVEIHKLDRDFRWGRCDGPLLSRGEYPYSHELGFSSLGIYRIALRPSAILDGSGETVVGEPQQVSFAVGTKATWLASYYGGDDLVAGSCVVEMSLIRTGTGLNYCLSMHSI